MAGNQVKQARFKLTDRVCLRSNPGYKGEVIQVTKSKRHGPMYLVSFRESDQRFVAESALLPAGRILLGQRVVTCYNHLDDLRREILLSKLRSPHGESLYSLRGSRVEFHVYQFKPVLKFLRNPEHRLLIADEVGLGKTIEAGIIMTELQARLAGAMPEVV